MLLFSNGLEKIAKEYGKTYADFEKDFRKYDDAVCRGQMTPQDLWSKYQEELGLVGG